MKEKTLTPITVTTKPNGYELTVGTEQFFEFNERQLIEAFFVRFALEETKVMERQAISKLMTAMEEYPTMMDALEEAATQRRENERLQRKVSKLEETVKALREPAPKKEVKKSEPEQDVINLNRKKEDKPKQERKSINKSEVIVVSRKPQTDVTPISGLSTKTMERLSVRISQTGLSSRARSIMMLIGGRANVTVLDALKSGRSEFLAARGCGKAVMDEIDHYVKDNGLAYGITF